MKPLQILFLLIIGLLISAWKPVVEAEKYSYSHYQELKKNIDQRRLWSYVYFENNKKNDGESELLERMSKGIQVYMMDSIVPYWLGTKWTYSGTTSVPRKGSIACGYFVTTVLRDAGFQIDRVKAGQMTAIGLMYGMLENESVCPKYRMNYSQLEAYIKSQGEGIYLLGLDSHIGFISYRYGEILFIHSSKMQPAGVRIEYASKSKSILNSTNKVIGSITHDKELMRKWIYKEEIKL